MGSSTPNLGFYKPDDNEDPWATDFRGGLDVVEERLSRSNAGDPNGVVTGDFVGQVCFDTTNNVLWFCVTVGAPGVWVNANPFLLPAQASTAGTALDFAIPHAFCRAFVITLTGVSHNGTTSLIAQLGSAGGIKTSGYFGGVGVIDDTVTNSGFAVTGAALTGQTKAANKYSGRVAFTLLDPSNHTWAWNGCVSTDDTDDEVFYSAGSAALGASQPLMTVRATSVAPNTFDQGKINVLVM